MTFRSRFFTTPPHEILNTKGFRRALIVFIALIGSAGAQLSNQLTAYWKFDGTLDDEVGNYPGQFNGTASESYATAKFGQGIDLNGVDQYVEIPGSSSSLNPASGDLSVSLWISTTGFTSGWQAAISKGEGTAWRIARRSTSQRIAYAGGTADIPTNNTTGPAIDDGALHHVVAITEGGVSTRLWVDGVLVATSAGAPNLEQGNNANLFIGANPDTNPLRYWNGVIDEVAIWDRVITPAELASIWNGGAGESIENLTGNIDLDGDGMPNTWELANNLDPNDATGVNGAAGDLDGDGLTNLAEYDGSGVSGFSGGTAGNVSDTDSDGLSDGAEVLTHNTNPLVADSDGDTLSDGDEITIHFTDPKSSDSDGDGVNDGTEISNGWDPNNANDPPNQWGAGLIGYWSFDGTHVEDSGTGRDGTHFGDPATFVDAGGTFPSQAKFGQGVFLNGTNQYIRLGGNGVDYSPPTGEVSVSAWFTAASFSTGWQTLMSKGEGNAWRIARQSTSNNLAYAGGSVDTDGGPNINDGQLHHVVAISEAGVGTRIYIDGVLTATGGQPNLEQGVAVLPLLGSNPDSPGRKWHGVIDDVAIWDRVLTDSEVAQIWNGGTGTPIGDLVQSDADGDGLPDDWEVANGLNPNDATGTEGASGDPDVDGLNNLAEYTNATDPQNPDSDNDGLNDGLEVTTYGSNPLIADTDGDGLSDGGEVNTYGTSPVLKDTDGDGLNDEEEVNTVLSNPTFADSDGDGAEDGLEVLLGFDPNGNGSVPPAGSALSGVASAGVVGPYLDGVLPVQTPNTGSGSTWAVNDAYPNASFGDLKGVVSEPNPDAGDGKSYVAVVERAGTVQRIEWGDAAARALLNNGDKTQVLNISSLTVNGDNGGLRTVVFHPEYNQAGSPNKDFLYAFYSTTANASRGFSSGDGTFFYRVSRFTRNPATGIVDNSSELVMIQQMSRDLGQHFGGGMTFGTDGFLYIAWGDMEFSSSRVGVPFYQDSQRIDRIFQSAMLCLDVDQTGGGVSSVPTRSLQGNSGSNALPGTSQSCSAGHNYYHPDNFSGMGYYIPLSNYWNVSNNVPPAGSAGISAGVSYPAHGPALEEHVALGFRNPWRLWTDPVSGDIGIAIVGSNGGAFTFEEFEVLVQGGNYGWAYREGDQSQTDETGRTKGPGGESFAPTYLGVEIDPVAFHSHGSGNVAVGGAIYQGTKMSTLAGMMVVGDHGSGKIWAVDYQPGGATVVAPKTELIDTSLAIRQMNLSPDGQDVLLAANGNIHVLEDTSPPIPEPPATLSATGAFVGIVSNLNPRAGLLPYEPISPLWSDRAKKPRFIAVPNTAGVSGVYDDASEKILFSENGEWDFPIGTTLIKHFQIPTDENDPDNPAKQNHVETRFLVKGQDGNWYSFTYAWRDTQDEADLIPDGDTSSYTKAGITIQAEGGGTYQQTWEYPSRSQCFDCHQPAANHVLGIKTRQLNNSLAYASSGLVANQLATLDQLNLFDRDLDILEMVNYVKSANISDTSQSAEDRVRSYLDSNCSHCHRPGSVSGLASFDARLTTPLALAGIIDEDPHAGNLGLLTSKIVASGDPANSILWVRDASVDPAIQMPPLAKSMQDPEYIAVLTEWINSLGGPPENLPPVLDDTSFVVAESSSFGTLVGSASGSDPNAGDVLSYAITGGNVGGAFAIDSLSGAITVTGSIDFEALNLYSLTVEVSDDGSPSLNDTAIVTVNVSDANEPPSATGGGSIVSEDDGIGTSVFVVTASDPDANSLLSFAITGGNDGGVFAIDSGTGVISLTGGLDYEVQSLYSLTATVSDNGVPALTDVVTVTVTVDDVNETPVAVDGGGVLAENTAPGAFVAAVVASDPDSVSVLSFAITGGDPSGVFAINGGTGEISLAGLLDFEMTSSYSLTVEVSDDGLPSLSDTATIVVSVLNVNEPPIVSDGSGSIPEDVGAGAVVATVGAFDPDAGTALTYSLTGGNTGNGFAIDGMTGAISVVGGLDFETVNSYSLEVTVQDDGTPALSDLATVLVSVTNINEDPVADDLAVSVQEDAVVGTSVGGVSATDPDAGTTLGYAITGGNTGNAFAIDSVLGTITVAGVLDADTQNTYLLTVTVSDDSVPSLSDTASVTITVTGVVISPTIVTGGSSGVTQSEATIAYTLSDDGGEQPGVILYYGETNGGSDPGLWENSQGLGVQAEGNHSSLLSGLTAGTAYFYTFAATNSAGTAWGSVGSFTTEASSEVKLARLGVSGVSSSGWTSVDLGQSYQSAVIIATPIYPDTTFPPVVTRLRNVTGSSFELTIGRADGQTGAVSCDVSIVAVEEGIYTQADDGVTMEAVTYTSTLTAENNNWSAEARIYQNVYTAPVVLGQVMSANDPDLSVFWCQGANRNSPPSASSLFVGKTVNEDPDATRVDEVVGYIVIESGAGTLDGVGYLAGLGADTVRGIGNSTSGYTYTLSGLASASAAAISQAGMDGGNGGWAVLLGVDAITTTSLRMAIDEDQENDTERRHTTEQVGYLIFE